MRPISRRRMKAKSALRDAVAAYRAERNDLTGERLAAAAVELLAVMRVDVEAEAETPRESAEAATSIALGAYLVAPGAAARGAPPRQEPCERCGSTGGFKRYDGLCAACADRLAAGVDP